MHQQSFFTDVQHIAGLGSPDAALPGLNGGSTTPSNPPPSAATTATDTVQSTTVDPPHSEPEGDPSDSISAERRAFLPTLTESWSIPRVRARKGIAGKPIRSSPLRREYRPFLDEGKRLGARKAGFRKRGAATGSSVSGNITALQASSLLKDSQPTKDQAYTHANTSNAFSAPVSCDPFAAQRTLASWQQDMQARMQSQQALYYQHQAPATPQTHLHAHNQAHAYGPWLSALLQARAAQQAASVPVSPPPRPLYDPEDPAASMSDAEWRWRAYGAFQSYLIRPNTDRYTPRTFPDPFW